MDHGQTSAERLPELYRAILDAVGELERNGARREAARVRGSARRAYRVWDARAEQRLLRLQAEIDRMLAGPVGRPGGRRSLLARLPWSSRAPSSPPSPTT